MCNVTLLIVIVLCIGKIGAQNASFQDLLYLINTTRTYVYASSYLTYISGDALTCISYLMRYLTPTFLRGELCYNVGDRGSSREIFGELGNKSNTNEPFMKPYFWPGVSTTAPKYLKYYDNESHCGVFEITMDGKRHCELHVRNDSINKKDPFNILNTSCLTSYNEICEERKPLVILYSDICD
uniref:Lipocalin n=1 Tax=Rhipicephalus zambeziensis TaxID=60191 RepID=A0A224YCP2_9ACAR